VKRLAPSEVRIGTRDSMRFSASSLRVFSLGRLSEPVALPRTDARTSTGGARGSYLPVGPITKSGTAHVQPECISPILAA
jgi:hypothetical protein